MYKDIYHGSSKQGLKLIAPRLSSHGKKWVYATSDIAIASVFIRKYLLGDIATMMGVTPHTYVCERFEGALKLLYQGVKGSIYTLPGEFFRQKEETYELEVVSDQAVIPFNEVKIEDNLEFLRQLEQKSKLKIYRYPSRPTFVPEDDEDLVMKAVFWSKRPGGVALQAIEKFHPHLITRVNSILENDDILIEKSIEWLGRFEDYRHMILSELESGFIHIYKQVKESYSVV